MAFNFSFGGITRSLGLDRYDLMARLRPALFVLFPPALIIGFWIPDTRSMYGSILSLSTGLGLTYFLVQLARQRGRSVEHRLGDRIGRLHSARLLLLNDERLPRESKKRYHSFLAKKGLGLSTLEEERNDPSLALDRTRSAIDWLLNFTRLNAKQSLLFDDNIAYGYMRNMLGLKPIAIAIVCLALATNSSLLVMSWNDPMTMKMACLIEATLIAILTLWLFLVTENAVAEASFAYAQRLFSHCETRTIKPSAS